MSGVPPPVVRSLIACEEIRPDDRNPRRLSLLRVINTIRATSNPPFPMIRPQFAVFAVLTNARGGGELSLEIRRAEDDAVVYRSPTRRIAFPADPLVLSGVSYGIRNLVFTTAGLYWVQLRYNGDLLADLPVVVR